MQRGKHTSQRQENREMINQTTEGLTVRTAVSGEPEAQWTDSAGQVWTTDEVLSQWPQDQLDAKAGWAEGALGMPAITSGGKTLLTMLPPTGMSIPDVPVVEPNR
jgi:hypothetical protein